MSKEISQLLHPIHPPFKSILFWIFHFAMTSSVLVFFVFDFLSIDGFYLLMILFLQLMTIFLQIFIWNTSEKKRVILLEKILLDFDSSWEVVRESVRTDEEVDLLYQAFTKVHFQVPESISPRMQRASDEKGPSWGKEEATLSPNVGRRDAIESSSMYDGLDGPLQIGEKIVEEANQKYAQEAQIRWEEAEKNDADLIEAGVERLGDLLRTDWFEKNSEDGVVARLMSNNNQNNDG